MSLLALFATLGIAVGQETAQTALPMVAIEAQVQDVREKILEATVGLRFRSGHATGVIVSEEGHILTVAHAMSEPGRRVTVVLSDGRELEGRTRGRNEHGDYGMVQIVEENETFTHCQLAPADSLQWGEICLATGHPGWISKSRGAVLRFGVLNGWTDEWVRTGCAIMPGDSGGPVFDLEGRVIAISSWIETMLDANYAVPASLYRDHWERLDAGEVWDRDSDPDRNRDSVPRAVEANRVGLVLRGRTRNASVQGVLEGSPAARAGIEPGDVIRAVNGDNVGSWRRAESLLVNARRTGEIVLRVERDGAELDVRLDNRTHGVFPEYGAESLREVVEQFAEEVRPSVVGLHSRFGSVMRNLAGVIVDDRGAILTKASELGTDTRVLLSSSRTSPVRLVAQDEETDLALLQIESESALQLTALTWNTEFLFEQGDWVASITPTEGRSSNGILSNDPRRVRGSRRAYLGVRMQDAGDGGALIQTVEPGTAAQRAGLRVDDVVFEFEGKEIERYFDLQDGLRRSRPGDRVELRVRRDGEELTLTATLGRRPPWTGSRDERHVADNLSLSARRSGFPLAVRHDANVTSAECGTPLIDARGRVVGLNIARVDRVGTLALPASEVVRVLEELLPQFPLKDERDATSAPNEERD